MNEKYTDMKERHEKEVGELPIIYAFSQRQLDEGCRRLGVTEPSKELYKFGSTGAFYRKSDSELIHGTFRRHEAEIAKAMNDKDFAVEAFRYEADNHEYSINWQGEYDMALCFGFPYDHKAEHIVWEEIPNGEFLSKCYAEGIRRHIKWFNEHN